ncbi:UPF0228 family protein [Methanococcoides burtonii]|uniref:Uncharacterized protein n=1 Tax=Methanococcoides burtonii (strain DSM 6242 / NBRC 107633 / OCM 468 / ACE-M) TaxID=259564 RepID=Q12Y32_METBU|nr:UPF0228 family protein [Methanococcoides burtonii]ABE51644.1 protein of unknown function with UPF0228 domain [Methanococcoides burtonii DSM 6242]
MTANKKVICIVLSILILLGASVLYTVNGEGETGGSLSTKATANTTSASATGLDTSFPSSDDAFGAADQLFNETIESDLPVGNRDLWKAGTPGTPLLITDIDGNSAYWLVPVEYGGRIIGFIDVSGDGKIQAFGMYGPYCDDPDTLDHVPLMVPEMSADYVMTMAAGITMNYTDCRMDEPVLVYYEIEGHEAWMLNVRNDANDLVSRVFVTPEHVFESVVQEFDERTGLWRKTEQDEPMIGGIAIMFEDGMSETEAEQILGMYDLGDGYELQYDVDYFGPGSYVCVDENNFTSVKQRLQQTENWIDAGPAIRKGDRYYIEISEHVIEDYDFEDEGDYEGREEVREILNIYDLPVKRFVWCYLEYGSGTEKQFNEANASRIKKELEGHEMILKVYLDCPEG